LLPWKELQQEAVQLENDDLFVQQIQTHFWSHKYMQVIFTLWQYMYNILLQRHLKC